MAVPPPSLEFMVQKRDLLGQFSPESKRLKDLGAREGDGPLPSEEITFLSYFIHHTTPKWRDDFLERASSYSTILSPRRVLGSLILHIDFLAMNYAIIAGYLRKKMKDSNCFELSSYYRPYDETSLNQLCRNMANFCGVDGTLEGENLLGGYRHVVYRELLSNLSKLNLGENRKDLALAIRSAAITEEVFACRPFEKVKKQGVLNKKRIDQIISGKPVIIPIGYRGNSYAGFDHYVDVVFCGNQFAICNRGAKTNLRKNLLFYEYKIERLNTHVIEYLLYSFFGYVPPNKIFGLEHQEIYLYEVLPRILEAVPIFVMPSLEAKEQKTGNCSKATPLLSFRVALFYILGRKKTEAAEEARLKGKMASSLLRKQSIQKVKALFDSVPQSEKETIGNMIAIAEGKLKKPPKPEEDAPALAGAGSGKGPSL